MHQLLSSPKLHTEESNGALVSGKVGRRYPNVLLIMSECPSLSASFQVCEDQAGGGGGLGGLRAV